MTTLDDVKRMGFREPRVQANTDSRPYSEYLPKQVEHCLRLTLERLQLGLKKDTTILSAGEVESLALAAAALYDIYYTFK